MENAINILNRSIENLKSEALKKKKELDTTLEQKKLLEEEIEIIVTRVNELNDAIKQLEGKSNATSTKNKKTKR